MLYLFLQNELGCIHPAQSSEAANLKDNPMRILDDGERIVHEFEVTALDLQGENYLGSVSWGYQGWNEMKEGTQDYNV